MYRKGHYGVTLLLFAPVGAALVLAEASTFAYLTGVVMLWLAMLPDVDQRVPGVSHRGVTHTVAFAVVVGVALAAGGIVAADTIGYRDPVMAATVGFFAGVLAVLAHLLADVLTPAGVPLLWPLSTRSFSLRVVRADNPFANYLLFAAGVFAAAVALALTTRAFGFGLG